MLRFKKYIGLAVSVFIGTALFEYEWLWYDAAENQDMASSFAWILSEYSGVFFAILAAIPFSTRYIRDYKTGYLKILFTKQSRQNYIRELLIKNGLAGGLALALPAVIVCIQIIMHYGFDNHVDVGTTCIYHMKEWASGHELPYVLLMIAVIFLCGVTFATFSLGISAWLKSGVLTLLLPFALTIVTAIFPPGELNFMLLYSPNISGHMKLWVNCLMEIFLLGGGIALFVTGVNLNERD